MYDFDIDIGTKMAVANDVARQAIAELINENESLRTKTASADTCSAEHRSAVQGLVDQLVAGDFVKLAEADRLVADGLASPAALLRSTTEAVRAFTKRAGDIGIVGSVGPKENSKQAEDNTRRGEPVRASDAFWNQAFGTVRHG